MNSFLRRLKYSALPAAFLLLSTSLCPRTSSAYSDSTGPVDAGQVTKSIDSGKLVLENRYLALYESGQIGSILRGPMSKEEDAAGMASLQEAAKQVCSSPKGLSDIPTGFAYNPETKAPYTHADFEDRRKKLCNNLGP